MIILKFGGTSVRDAHWIGQAISIAEAQLERDPVLVASAMGKTTDTLVELSELALSGKREEVTATVDQVQRNHEAALSILAPGDSEIHDTLGALIQELRNLLQGVTLIRECSPRTQDALLSFGERLSTLLIAAGARARGIECRLHDSRTLLRTDSSFGSATPDMENTTTALREAILGAGNEGGTGILHVLQGFIASDSAGVTTTLGRGGSDYTATIVGAALEADEVQIWTDVDGIMSADPRVVDGARTLKEISYAEAAELAFFGARVVHPYTIQPAIERGIPVYVRNTERPELPGTRITGEFAERGVRAITVKRGITVITINSYRMLNAYGFLSRIFDVFARHHVSVDLVATSEVSVSMTVDTTESIPEVVSALEAHGQVHVEDQKAIVSLVGKDLWKDSSVLARVFQTMEGIPVRLISLGSSDTNLSLVVSEGDSVDTVQRLHRAFFSS
ncbi:MAG: lysine-sensitive aspartokinase 3 [Spirochaetes bacterium]|nr:lysine-sensitive aspartokinase 3 [Spirochaetota bacterium]